MSRALIIALLLCLGCDRVESITTYPAPKDSPPPQEQPAAQPEDSEIHWTVPAGWKETANVQFAQATFLVSPDAPDVKCTATPMAPIEGALLSNVNRWEGQLGLPPTPAGELANVARRITVGSIDGARVDLSSADKTRRLLGVILAAPGQLWIFKLMGPSTVVDAQQSSFDAFISSVHFGHAAPPQPTAIPGLTWTLPAGWRALDEQKPMRLATIVCPGEDHAEVVVSTLASANWGDLLPNLNRWRNSVGLEPLDDSSKQPLEKQTVDGREWTTVDFAGKDTRMVVSFVTVGDAVWFFKFQGTLSSTERESSNFRSFIKSIKFDPGRQ